MIKAIKIILTIFRLYIMINVIYLLYLTKTDPDNHPLDKLTWWVYYLVFDIWLQFFLPAHNENEEIYDEGQN
jgi:hypothetical protein